MKQSLWTKDFTLVVLGQIISLFGNGILRFALPLYLLDVSGSPALFGAVSGAAFLPMVLLSPVGGIIADRVNKQRVMVALDFSTAALMLSYTLLQHRLPLVPLLVAALMLLYGIQGAYQPAVQASIPLLAQGEKLIPANAVINQVSSLANLLGPVLGGLLYSGYGILPILVVSVGCFAFSAIMELFIRIPHTPRIGGQGVWSIVKADTAQSLSYMFRQKPVLSKMVGLVSMVNLFGSALLIIGVPVIITQTLGLSGAHYGFCQGAMALGGLAGGICAGVLGKRLAIQRAHLLLLFCTLGMLPLGLMLLPGIPPMVSYGVITIVGFAIMAGSTLFTIQVLAFVQAQTPVELVGKVISCMMAVSMLTQPLGQTLYGQLFERLAVHAWGIVTASSLVAGAFALLSTRIFRSIPVDLPTSPMA